VTAGPGRRGFLDKKSSRLPEGGSVNGTVTTPRIGREGETAAAARFEVPLLHTGERRLDRPGRGRMQARIHQQQELAVRKLAAVVQQNAAVMRRAPDPEAVGLAALPQPLHNPGNHRRGRRRACPARYAPRVRQPRRPSTRDIGGAYSGHVELVEPFPGAPIEVVGQGRNDHRMIGAPADGQLVVAGWSVRAGPGVTDP